MPGEKQSEKPTESEKSSISVMSEAFNIGFSVLIIIFVLTAIGIIADKKLDTFPWLLLISAFVAIILSLVVIVKKANKIIKIIR